MRTGDADDLLLRMAEDDGLLSALYATIFSGGFKFALCA